MILAIKELGISRELIEQEAVSFGRKGFGADIEIDHEMVSRQHASVKLDNGRLIIIDNHSKNGVSINDQRIQPGVWREFGAGDKLNIIGLDITFATAVPVIQLPVQPPPSDNQQPQQRERSPLAPADNKKVSINEKFKALLAARGPIRIGRATDNDIILPDQEPNDKLVSRHHAEIAFRDGDYWIEDLGSKNGTYINDERLYPQQPKIIAPQDSIIIHLHLFSLAEGYRDLREEVAIRAVGLEKKYGNTIGLHALDIDVPRNQIVALMGPSGCGKSTLLKALNGDNPATGGEVFIHGLSLRKNYNLLKRKIGYVPQDDIIHKELTVNRTLYLAAKLRLPDGTQDTEIQNRINEVLAGLNFEERLQHQKVEKLSGGQRKRVCIAVELLSRPTILFLDEPTSPLDPESIKEFLDSLRKLAENGTTIIMVTHKPEDLYYADKIIFLAAKGFMVHHGQLNGEKGLLTKFGVDNIIKVYNICGAGEFDADRYYIPPSHKPAYHAGTKEMAPDKENSLWLQQYWLTRRYMEIKASDKNNLLLLFSQPFIIAGLIAFIFHTIQISVMMLIAISAIWFGVSNSSKEIVGEYSIYKRERMFNLNIHAYILSKWLVLSAIALIQVVIFLSIVYLRFGMSSNTILGDYWSNIFFMFYIACAATLFGLSLSAFFSTTEKVLTVVPIALMPQIMLAGIVERLTSVKVDVISYFTLGRWGTEGLARLQKGPFKKDFTLDDFYYNPALKQHTVTTLFNSLQLNILVILVISIATYLFTYGSLKRKDTI